MNVSRFKLTSLILIITFSLLATWGFKPAPTAAQSPLKPEIVTISSYEVGGGSYTICSALGEGIFKKFGTRIRIIPLGTAIARINYVRTRQADIGVTSDDLFATEGLYDWAAPDWGPQPLRAVYFPGRVTAYSLATRADSGIKTMADLKGKKVPFVVGQPANQNLVAGSLAFGGLTWNDVTTVKVSGTRAMYQGVIDGKTDVSIMDTNSPKAYELEASPHGIYWIPMPVDDKEAWDRHLALNPLHRPILVKAGAGISKDKPVWLTCYPYPRFYCYDWADEELIYWIVKMTVDSYDAYKDITIQMPPFKLEEAVKEYCTLPYHPGTVKYFKEAGVWTAQLEKNQKELLARQAALKELWDETVEESVQKSVKAKEWKDFWLKKRTAKFPTFWRQTPVK